jgi:hypothetical protein
VGYIKEVKGEEKIQYFTTISETNLESLYTKKITPLEDIKELGGPSKQIINQNAVSEFSSSLIKSQTKITYDESGTNFEKLDKPSILENIIEITDLPNPLKSIIEDKVIISEELFLEMEKEKITENLGRKLKELTNKHGELISLKYDLKSNCFECTFLNNGEIIAQPWVPPVDCLGLFKYLV